MHLTVYYITVYCFCIFYSLSKCTYKMYWWNLPLSNIHVYQFNTGFSNWGPVILTFKYFSNNIVHIFTMFIFHNINWVFIHSSLELPFILSNVWLTFFWENLRKYDKRELRLVDFAWFFVMDRSEWLVVFHGHSRFLQKGSTFGYKASWGWFEPDSECLEKNTPPLSIILEVIVGRGRLRSPGDTMISHGRQSVVLCSRQTLKKSTWCGLPDEDLSFFLEWCRTKTLSHSS